MAGLLGCDATEVALTGSTTDGVNAVLAGARPARRRRDRDERRGAPGPARAAGGRARAARRSRSAWRRCASWPRRWASAPGSWRARTCPGGRATWWTAAPWRRPGRPCCSTARRASGAVPVNVRLLGCDFYAASGQKWLCGPNGTGYLYVRAERAAELAAPLAGLRHARRRRPTRSSRPSTTTRGASTWSGFPAEHQLAWALAALDVLEEAGLRAGARAGLRAGGDARAEARRAAAARWRRAGTRRSSPGARRTRQASWPRLGERGFVLRDLPGTPVRARLGRGLERPGRHRRPAERARRVAGATCRPSRRWRSTSAAATTAPATTASTP